MKSLSLIVLLIVSASVFAQRPNPELARLHDEYIKATKDYKQSLQRLKTLYENSAAKAEDKLAQSKQLYKENLMSIREVEGAEEVLKSARLKVAETEQQIQSADQQIADALATVTSAYSRAVDEEAKQRKRAIAARRRVPPPCRNWTVQTEHGNGLPADVGGGSTPGFKIVCGSHR